MLCLHQRKNSKASIKNKQTTKKIKRGKENSNSKKATAGKAATAAAAPQVLNDRTLILFEEIDVLFDDDRGFTSAVISLMQRSKRPIVLTCNGTFSSFRCLVTVCFFLPLSCHCLSVSSVVLSLFVSFFSCCLLDSRFLMLNSCNVCLLVCLSVRIELPAQYTMSADASVVELRCGVYIKMQHALFVRPAAANVCKLALAVAEKEVQFVWFVQIFVTLCSCVLLVCVLLVRCLRCKLGLSFCHAHFYVAVCLIGYHRRLP